MAWNDLFTEVLKLVNFITLKPSREIKKVVKIYDEMHRVLADTDVERFLIFKAHNGGGLIRPMTPLYASVIHEDYTEPFTSVKEKYQQLRIDSEYIRLLDQVCGLKKVEIYTKDVKSQFLKEIYDGEGVKYSEVFFLGQDKKNLYYCSIVSSKEKAWQNHKDQELAISIAINNIRNNII